MAELILMSDERVARIPVVDCGEPLIDLAADATAPWVIDARLADDRGDWRHLRSGVADRLRRAADALPDGLQLRVIEGFRPPHLQRKYFENYRAQVVSTYPDKTDEETYVLASRYISPPEIAPHSAGAAIDLTIQTVAGVEVDMGTIYDATPEDSDGACYTDAENVTADARANRAVLKSAMAAGGFVNYPTEWWHWSFGDRYWALMSDRPNALYGPTSP